MFVGMHWDQMTATPDELRKHATRLRRGVGQIGILEAILSAAEGPWLGAMDADGRGTAELRMHLAGRYRVKAVVTSAGKLSSVQLIAPVDGRDHEHVLSTKPALRRGWDDDTPMPKQPKWLDYLVEWVRRSSTDVDRRSVLEWHLEGADRRLAFMNETIDSLRESLAEREQLRDELAGEVAGLRAELDSLANAGTGTLSTEPRDDAPTEHPDGDSHTAGSPGAAAADPTTPA